MHSKQKGNIGEIAVALGLTKKVCQYLKNWEIFVKWI